MNTPYGSEKDDDFVMVKNAAKALGEHFDSVQIFVTVHEPEVHDGTVNLDCGVGNWFARYGQVRDWLSRQEAPNVKITHEE